VRLTCVAVLAILAMGGSGWCQEVVTNEPLTKKQLIATLPLLTLPKLDVDKVITAANDKNSNTWMVSAPAAVSSVLLSEQLPKDLKQAVNSIPTGDWADIKTWQPDQREAMASAVEHWKTKYLSDERRNHFDRIIPVTAVNNTEFKEGLPTILPRAKDVEKEKTVSIMFIDGSHEDVNTTTIERILTANSIIEDTPTKTNENSPYTLAMALSLNTRFANDIQAVYFPIKSISRMGAEAERLPAANSAIREALTNPGVAATLLINLGEAGLGQPLPFTAKDKSLNVEPSLTRRYDIYWIDLAFSPSEELLGNATELRYDIAMLDDDTIALDLLPMRFGREVGEKDGMSVPSIKVGSVEVGEMFSRTVEYKRLLPTVLSHGLQTQTFGWTFTGDSLDASAKRMFAVIGVPKGTKQVKTRITLEAKCREYAGFASEWASTGPTSYTIALPQ
jgi:hypothetical protein